MKRLLCLLLVLLLSGCAAPAQGGDGERHVTELLAMDTIMKLTIYGENGREAGEHAKARIQELERLLSTTDEASEVYEANHSGTASLSADTAALLERALALCDATQGVLDITIYPVVQAWGFTTGQYQVPLEADIAALLDRVDYRRVSLEDGRLTLPEGVEIDLGAVAKGFTGDQLMALLREEGVTSATVELGGNVQTLGAKPDGTPWRIAVQSPDNSGYAGVLEVIDRAVVTSGGYQRYFEENGEIYWHIIDPATGHPARSGLQSVTIVAEEGVLCDALSTALFIMGAEKASAFWREQGGFDFVLIDDEGTILVTEGLEDSFSPYETDHPLEVVRR